MKVELMPGKGITIDGTVIELGQNIKNIKLNSEVSEYFRGEYYLCDCLQLSTDKKGNIKEITCFCETNFEATFCLVSDCLEVYLKQYNLLELEVEDAVKVMNTILEEEVVLTGKNNSCYDWEKSGVYAWQKVTKFSSITIR